MEYRNLRAVTASTHNGRYARMCVLATCVRQVQAQDRISKLIKPKEQRAEGC